jgi:Uma2 family endonuclease
MHVATQAKRWTLDELHSLPDDGNKYELVNGELFVTPAPSVDHETILARLSRLLEPYVAEHNLGLVYHPRAVFRFKDSEVEPDLMVRQPAQHKHTAWELVPRPTLIVEVLSDSTRRRDRLQKREFYAVAEIPEYWIIDPERSEITVIRRSATDLTVRATLEWKPDGANGALSLPAASLFE